MVDINSSHQRWIFVAQATNKPGTITAAAAVFSNRGVSLEGILGSAINTTAEEGRLLLSFRANKEKKDLLLRSLQRLPSIAEVAAYAYEDTRLRAVAVAKVSLKAQIDHNLNALYTEVILKEKDTLLLLLSGGTEAVEDAIAHFRKQNQLQDVVMSTITV